MSNATKDCKLGGSGGILGHSTYQAIRLQPEISLEPPKKHGWCLGDVTYEIFSSESISDHLE